MRAWLASRWRRPLTPRGAVSPRTFAAVGYPKVGNTWLRLTLGRYLQETYGLEDMPLMDSAEFPVLIGHGCRAVGDFTHAPLEWFSQTPRDLTRDNVVGPFRNLRVVLLVRHPLDTLVSLYMQERYRNADAPFTGTVAEFIEHGVFGLDKLLRFYRVWADGKGDVAAFHLWRYEDALASPVEEFSRLLTFLNEPVRADIAARAVKFAAFDNVRALELSGRQPVYKSSGFPIFATADFSNPDARHVRKGKAGGYREDIPAELLKGLEDRVVTGMPVLYGYGSSS